MKRQTYILIFLQLIFTMYIGVYAEKVVALPEVLRPYSMQLDGTHIYVVDNNVIRMYSMKDYKYLKQIGKKGSGPGEFPFSPHVTIYPDLLLVNTWGKFLSFSRDGEYRSEKKLSFPVQYFEYPFLKAGENYLGEKNTPGERTIGMCLFDKDLKEIKVLSRGMPQRLPPPPRPGEQKPDYDVIGESWSYTVYKNNIYISDTRKGFYFQVFDSTGKKLYEINHPVKRQVVTDQFKQDHMKRSKESPGWERNKTFYNHKFGESFPPFASFKVNDDKIYAYTFNKKGGKFEIIVMDLRGKILRRTFAGPVTPNTNRFQNLYSIHDDKFYYISEDEANEEWSLHSVKIK